MSGSHLGVTLWDLDSGREVASRTLPKEISFCCFSPDPRVIVCAGEVADVPTVCFWKPDSDELESFAPGTRSILGLGFSPDWSRMAIASKSGTVPIVALDDRSSVTCVGHNDWTKACAFSPDGTRLVSASLDGTLRIWDSGDGRELAKLESETASPVQDCAFSPDGSLIASAALDAVRVWDAQVTGTGPDVHDEPISFCQFSPDGGRILTAGAHTQRSCDAERGHLLPVRTVHSSAPFGYSPGGEHVGAFLAGHCMLRNAVTGAEIRSLGEPSGGLETSAAYSPDGRFVVIVAARPGGESLISTRETATGRELGRAECMGRVERWAFSPDGTRLATVHGLAELWAMPEARKVAHLAGLMPPMTCVAFSGDGRLVATGVRDGSVRLWDGVTGRALHRLSRHGAVLSECTFEPRGNRLVCASEGGAVRLWDAETREDLGALARAGRGAVSAIRFSPDGRWLLLVGDTIEIWDPTHRRLLAEYPYRSRAVAWAPAGPRLAVGVGRNLHLIALELADQH